MKIYTKTGDTGDTALLGGGRVSESDPRIDAYGEIDELNAHLGLLADLLNNNKFIRDIQAQLFSVGAGLYAITRNKNIPDIKESWITDIEKEIDLLESSLPELRFFILPGGHSTVSHIHISRAVCRRAERSVIRAAEEQQVHKNAVKYLNRLSDYLFVLARYTSQAKGIEEIKWNINNRKE